MLSTYVRIQNALRSEDRGATAVEYGLLVALIAAVIIAVVAAIGGSLSSAFGIVNDGLENAIGS